MDEPKRPTLDSIPEVLPHMIRSTPLGPTISAMQFSGFHKWGFVIYRGAYSDDGMWQRYMDELKSEIRHSLDSEGQGELLSQYLDYTVIEDANLEGASKNDIRKQFRKWIAKRSLERDEPGIDAVIDYDIPRFTHCLYVDQNCLNTLACYENWCKQGCPGYSPGLICSIIDVDCKASGKHGSGFPDVEGCTKWYTGWMYLIVSAIPGVYDMLSSSRLDNQLDFVRPPLVFPTEATLRDTGEVVRE